MTVTAPRWAMPAAMGVAGLAFVVGLAMLPLRPAPSGAASAPPGATPTPSATAMAPTPAATPTPPPLPDPDVLTARLGKVSRSGLGATGIVVLDASGGSLLASRGDRPLVPASTLKILTALAALDSLGPEVRFTTRVVSSAEGRIVLVGGGDPLLTDKQLKSSLRPASLQGLATATAAALKDQGVESVRLGYDASLFAGTGWGPNWPATWKSFTARVSPLLVNSGKLDAWRAAPDPARAAADTFAARLRKAGIKVSRVAAEEARDGASEIAAVSSAPLSAIVKRIMTYSDNVAADVLARHVARAAGRNPTFAGGNAALTEWLRGRGLWADGMRIDDGSGVSAKSRIAPGVLARAIDLALDTPAFASVIDGLPVAGETGTLEDRFADAAEKAGRKVVRAKTGTLPGVATLAGTVTTRDGALLVFAAMANKAPSKAGAYNWLDRSASVLARCGCR